MGVETRKSWLLVVALAVGFVAFEAGVWLVLHAARSAGEDAARGPMGPREVTPAEEELIVEALERDHGGAPRIEAIETEALSDDPPHQSKIYRVTFHAPSEAGLPRVRFFIGAAGQLMPLDREESLGWERGDWREQARQAKTLHEEATRRSPP